jgi:hypothetical protein
VVSTQSTTRYSKVIFFFFFFFYFFFCQWTHSILFLHASRNVNCITRGIGSLACHISVHTRRHTVSAIFAWYVAGKLSIHPSQRIVQYIIGWNAYINPSTQSYSRQVHEDRIVNACVYVAYEATVSHSDRHQGWLFNENKKRQFRRKARSTVECCYCVIT